MERSLDLFRARGDRWGEAMALVTARAGRAAARSSCGCAATASRRASRWPSATATTLGGDDRARTTSAGRGSCWRSRRGARPTSPLSVALSRWLGHVEGVAYGLEGLVAVAALAGDAERAGRLAGAPALRERTGLHNGPTFTFHQLFLDADAGTRAPIRGAFDAAVDGGTGPLGGAVRVRGGPGPG